MHWSGRPGQHEEVEISVDLRVSAVTCLTESSVGKSGMHLKKAAADSTLASPFCSLFVGFPWASDLRGGLLLHWIAERCMCKYLSRRS